MDKLTTNRRLHALDILRGITIAGMILVNNPGSYTYKYAPLHHAEWNGLTPTDLVFPFFMFIMGISTFLSLRKCDFRYSHAVGIKILRRTALIFLISLCIDWFSRFCYCWSTASMELTLYDKIWFSVNTFDRLRILGVLQRLALSYGAVALIALWVKHKHIPYIVIGLLVGYWLLLWFGNGFAYDNTNILSKVDCALLTPAHMYVDHGMDPEGVLGTIPSIAHVLLGFWIGSLFLGAAKKNECGNNLQYQLIVLFLAGVILTFTGFLLSYGCPINKKVWSPTFVLVTCGFASSLLGLLIWVIDVKGYKKWSVFFESFGVNPLFMYVFGTLLATLFGYIHFSYEGVDVSIHDSFFQFWFQPLLGNEAASLLYAILFVLLNWCVAYFLYKRKIFIKL